jgi:hypothetical protein
MFWDSRFFPSYAVMNLQHDPGAVAPVMSNRQGPIPEGLWEYQAVGFYSYTVPSAPFTSGKTFFAYMNGTSLVSDSPPFSFDARRLSSTIVTLRVINAGTNDLADVVWTDMSFWIVVFK